jgi:two-component system sensor histidine kinase/response regulator
MEKRSISVVFIEDDPGDIHLLRRWLEDIPGWEVNLLTFTQPAEGLAHLSQHKVDIVLLDFLLGATTGLEVLKEIQRSGCKCPVVILTGHGHEELAAELMRYGAADYLPKSRLSANSLRRVISNAIAKYKLQEALDEHRRKLEESNRDLLSMNKEIKTFYHRLAHKLKSPATAARGYVDMVLEGSADCLPDTERGYLRMVQDCCNEICFCVEALVDVTNLQTGKLAMSCSPVAIDKLVRESLDSIAVAAQRKHIHMEQAIERNLPLVFVDDKRFKQVLSHLLSNAVKFTPEGGEIAIRVTDNPFAAEFVLVSVRDTGRGIERDKLPYIFGRLYQASDDDWTTHQGLGLGLYICRELVRLHGGDISVQSEPGEGTTFSFTIPKHIPQETSLPAAKESCAGKKSFSAQG